MNIRMVPLHEIKPYENNPRQHPVRQLESVANSIRDFKFRGSILLDKNNVIIAGHARYEAAAALGMSEIPCEIAYDLTEDEVIAFRILDNEIASQGNTDKIAMYLEMKKIPDFDFKPFNLEIKKLPMMKTEMPSEKCDEKVITCPNCNHEFVWE